MLPQEIETENFSRLLLDIYTVGYPLMGESIIIMLKDDSKVLFTVVTDSYKTSNYNHIIQIFQDNGNPPIDAFIWTHPDEDHSMGIEDLLERFDTGHHARIFIPVSLNKNILTNESAIAAYEYLHQHYNSGPKYLLSQICSIDSISYPVLPFRIKTRNSLYEINGAFRFLLPDSSLSERRTYCQAQNAGDINDYSIVYVLELNGLRYFFGGDLTRQSLQFMKGNCNIFLENVRFIKIPHHGSKEPLRLRYMLKPFQEKKAVATTTVYKTSHPYEETLDEYAQICEHISSTGRWTAPYGCIQLSFSATNTDIPIPALTGMQKS